jgi:hypothetical protein
MSCRVALERNRAAPGLGRYHFAPIAFDSEVLPTRQLLFLADPKRGVDAWGLHVCFGHRRVWLPHIDDAAYIERADALRK